MSRLIDTASKICRLPRPKDEFLELLNAAIRLRGTAAHGLLPLSTENSLLNCGRATAAIEALCCILMAVDLPISDDGKDRFASHRVIGGFAHMY